MNDSLSLVQPQEGVNSLRLVSVQEGVKRRVLVAAVVAEQHRRERDLHDHASVIHGEEERRLEKVPRHALRVRG